MQERPVGSITDPTRPGDSADQLAFGDVRDPWRVLSWRPPWRAVAALVVTVLAASLALLAANRNRENDLDSAASRAVSVSLGLNSGGGSVRGRGVANLMVRNTGREPITVVSVVVDSASARARVRIARSEVGVVFVPVGSHCPARAPREGALVVHVVVQTSRGTRVTKRLDVTGSTFSISYETALRGACGL